MAVLKKLLRRPLIGGLNWYYGQVINRFSKVSRDPIEAQEKVLFDILRDNEDCEYGRELGFKGISSVSDFQRKVPVCTYEDLEDRIERMKGGEGEVLVSGDVDYFAITTGTTERPKFIPITGGGARNIRRDLLLWRAFAFRDHPELVNGKSIVLSGPPYVGKTEGDISYGFISGYINKGIPKLIQRLKLVVPSEVYNIEDFAEKMHQIARLGLENDVGQLAASSTLEAVLFFDYIEQNREGLTREICESGNSERARELEGLADFFPKNYWPNLNLVSCMKGGFVKPYVDRIRRRIGDDVVIRDPGIISSEGRISTCISDKGAEGVLAASSNFFEFMEVDGEELGNPVAIGGLENGKDYAVLLTTSDGLYRYDIGDVVRVTDFYDKLPVVEFVDRKRNFSIAGEHVAEWELVRAVYDSAEDQGVRIADFTVIPNVNQTRSRYEFLMELNCQCSEGGVIGLTRAIDERLQKQNFLYRTKRDGVLDSPLVSVVRRGSYEKLNLERIQSHGTQVKPIHFSYDLEFRDRFEIEGTYSCSSD